MSIASARVGDLFPRILIGGTPSRANAAYFGGPHQWVSIADMDGQPIVSATKETLSDAGLQHSNCKRVPAGSLLFSFKLTVGRVSFAGVDLYTNEAIAAFDARDALASGVDLAYLSLALPLAAANDQTHNVMGVAMLNKKRIAALEIPFPGLDLQRRIAADLQAQLAAVETARKAAQAQVADAESLRQAICREAFAGIVPVSVPPDLGGAPVGWRWVKLNDPGIARLESGHTPSHLHPEWWGGDVSWVSLTEIRALDGQWVDETRLRTNAQGIAHSAARILPRGTVCYSRTASVGFVTIMGKPMATSQDFANWVCGDALDPEFLMHALIRSRAELRELASGATHKTIYMPTLSAFHLCMPERAAQERIVADLKRRLAAAQQIGEAARTRLADLEALPARLLARAFDPSDQGATP